ncbi:MAG: biotin/lipoyl-containing protein, partial [Burkholderiales bacterium]
MAIEEIKIPDIGDFKDIEVIEVLVKVGDSVKAEDSLLTLESDKATMEIPSPKAGVVKELKIKAGDKVSQGSLVLLLDTQAGTSAPTDAKPATPAPATAPPPAAPAAAPAVAPTQAAAP